MKSRRIVVPDAVDITPLMGEVDPRHASMTFHTFLLGRLRQPVFGASATAAAAQLEVLEASNRAEIVISDAAWQILARATSEPQGGYQVEIAHCLVPFMRAILEAEVINECESS